MGDNNPVKQEVQNFDKKCLKKTDTKERNPLPTKEAAGALSGLVTPTSLELPALYQMYPAPLTKRRTLRAPRLQFWKLKALCVAAEQGGPLNRFARSAPWATNAQMTGSAAARMCCRRQEEAGAGGEPVCHTSCFFLLPPPPFLYMGTPHQSLSSNDSFHPDVFILTALTQAQAQELGNSFPRGLAWLLIDIDRTDSFSCTSHTEFLELTWPTYTHSHLLEGGRRGHVWAPHCNLSPSLGRSMLAEGAPHSLPQKREMVWKREAKESAFWIQPFLYSHLSLA
ncbi:hypothetical protein JZ751_018785 [Albula glossodonta]|uniref:Uncharacterized protein n=1 Tax=Albula glossodonta TaxID=121402 RepID=A0A8T2NRH8_9TELE|nr:hypothetical protein JZ751_018785 [Albula glossodonta]